MFYILGFSFITTLTSTPRYNTYMYNTIYIYRNTLSAYFWDYLPVAIRGTSSRQRRQPLSAVSLKITYKFSIKRSTFLCLREVHSSSLHNEPCRTSGDLWSAVHVPDNNRYAFATKAGAIVNRVASHSDS